MHKLQKLIDRIPDGPVWVTGEFLEELGIALVEDRVLLAPGCGNVIPTKDGRVFDIQVAPSPGNLEEVFMGVAGIVRFGSVGMEILVE